ncbi:hypothetical protein ABT285_09945 [Streptomyces microflavus]|uniref:hypothetical protein n=1 Tax=Streptomyces microflavus TaxID=1919 RepID=UPI003320B48C
MPERIPFWTESLSDSVSALGATAHEFQGAHRAAELATDSVDYDRRVVHQGRYVLEGRNNSYASTLVQLPHDQALSHLSHLYASVQAETARHYALAALLYASGAAWAIRSIQRGHTPAAVRFHADDFDGAEPHATTVPRLDGYDGTPALEAAHSNLARCMDARDVAEGLADITNPGDDKIARMNEAYDIADGLADAAYAYGLLVHRALHHVLAEPRRARERELVAAYTAAQTTQPTP